MDSYIFSQKLNLLDYGSANALLHQWSDRVTNQTPGMWVFEEPLFSNGFLQTCVLQSATVTCGPV